MSDEILPREQLLDEAKATIGGPRAATYGDATASFQRIADLWTALLPVERALTGVDVAKAMAAMKLSRLHETPTHQDSWLDIAGYAALGYEIANKEQAAAEAEVWAR